MTPIPIRSLYEFIDDTGRLSKNDLVMFRGQNCPDPLLPKIARPAATTDTQPTEKDMLRELRRTGSAYLTNAEESDLDLMVRAQHFGMATRLLDWTSNPLVGLWFACCGGDSAKSGYVYVFEPAADTVRGAFEINDPFSTKKTLVFKPN